MNIEAIIENFGMEHFGDDIKVMSDLYEYHDFKVCGVKEDGAISGFGWIEHRIEFSGAYMPLTRHSVGIIGKEKMNNSDLKYNTHAVVSGVKYIDRSDYSEKLFIVDDTPTDLLLEYDDDGRIIFCGMQEEGKRHGLGVEFVHEGKLVKQQRGIWQNGVQTHRWENNSFVEI